MFFALLVSTALAASPDYPFTLSLGLGAGLGAATAVGDSADPSTAARVPVHLGTHEESASASATEEAATTEAVRGLTGGALGSVRAVWHLGRLGFDLGGRSGILANDLREVTQLSAGLRYAPGLPYARAGFVHSHETPWAVLEASPFEAAIGAADGIRHRTGGELAVGLAGALNPRETDGRMGAFAELSAVGFPDEDGPRLYGQVDVGFSYSLGRDRAAAEE